MTYKNYTNFYKNKTACVTFNHSRFKKKKWNIYLPSLYQNNLKFKTIEKTIKNDKRIIKY
jgi:hypothetical protein